MALTIVLMVVRRSPTSGHSLFSQELHKGDPWSEWMEAGRPKTIKSEQRAWITVVAVISGQGMANRKREVLVNNRQSAYSTFSMEVFP